MPLAGKVSTHRYALCDALSWADSENKSSLSEPLETAGKEHARNWVKFQVVSYQHITGSRSKPGKVNEAFC